MTSRPSRAPSDCAAASGRPATAEDLVERVRKRRQALAELLDFVRQASEAGPGGLP